MQPLRAFHWHYKVSQPAALPPLAFFALPFLPQRNSRQEVSPRRCILPPITGDLAEERQAGLSVGAAASIKSYEKWQQHEQGGAQAHLRRGFGSALTAKLCQAKKAAGALPKAFESLRCGFMECEGRPRKRATAAAACAHASGPTEKSSRSIVSRHQDSLFIETVRQCLAKFGFAPDGRFQRAQKPQEGAQISEKAKKAAYAWRIQGMRFLWAYLSSEADCFIGLGLARKIARSAVFIAIDAACGSDGEAACHGREE